MNSIPFYAVADIKGNNDYPNITGTVVFKKKSNGVLITAEIFNLPYEIGKTIIIHDKPDDFVSQPSGNAGNKIACGKILPM